MVLGFDIDDVIFDTSNTLKNALDECRDEEVLNHKLDIMKGDIVNEKVGEFIKKNALPTIKKAKPKDGACETIKEFRKKSNKVVLITSRGEKLIPGSEEVTKELLTRYGIEYDNLIFNSFDKVSVCKEYKVDIFVDDSPKHCLEVSNGLGIKVVGFISKINKEEMIKNNIKYVNSWKELAEIVNSTN